MGGAEEPAPPPPVARGEAGNGAHPTLLSQARRRYRSRFRHRGMRYWLPYRGAPIIAFYVILYCVNGVVIGWSTAYDITLGITSPAGTDQPVLAWVLSLAGWLLVPGIAGAVAGYIVTTQIEGTRQTPFSDLLPDDDITSNGPR
jgi:hypothetical protein